MATTDGFFVKLKDFLGQALKQGEVTGPLGDVLSEWLKTSSGELTQPIFQFLLDSLSDKNPVMDFRTGQVKTVGVSMLENVMHDLGAILSDVEIPTVTIPTFLAKSTDGKVYLSLERARELQKSLKEADDGLKRIPNKLGEYKEQSSKFINDFTEELNKYIEFFDIFAETNRMVRFFKGLWLNYSKVVVVRKNMKKSLIILKISLGNYKKEEYTFEAIKKRLASEKFGIKIEQNIDESVRKAVALSIFQDACEICADYKDEIEQSQKYAEKKIGKKGLEGEEKDRAVNEYFYNLVSTNPAINNEIVQALKRALQFTHGLNPDSYEKISKANAEDIMSKYYGEEIIHCLGWKACLTTAKDALKGFDDSSKILKNDNMNFRGPLMGDYVKKISACVDYTIAKLNEVINLGDKLDRKKQATDGSVELINSQTDSKDSNKIIDINFEELIGKQSGKKLDEMKKRQLKFEQKVKQNAVSSALKIYRECEKAKEKVDKLYNNYSGDKIPSLTKTAVMPSSSSETGEKNFDLDENFNTLKKLYTSMKANVGDGNWALLVKRKANKFLKAVTLWIEDFYSKKKIYESEISNRKKVAEAEIKDFKNRYKIVSKNIVDKNKKKIYRERYSKLPSTVRGYMKNPKASKEAIDKFMDIENEDDLRTIPLVRS